MPEATRAERPPRAPSLDAGAQSAPAAAARFRWIAEQIRLVLLGMRPRQWTKNLLLFAGVTFAGHLLSVAALSRALLAFAIFCLLAGATYLLNDLADLRGDRLHPTKRLRALASGRLSPRAAWCTTSRSPRSRCGWRRCGRRGLPPRPRPRRQCSNRTLASVAADCSSWGLPSRM